MKAFRFLLICLLLVMMPGNCCFAAADNAGVAPTIDLTQEEKDFIAAHPEIRLAVDPEFVPYEFFDSNGEYTGVASDYIKLICERTGLKMTVAEGLTWSEAYEKAVQKELDVLPCVSKTKEREQYFTYSEPYFSFQRVIFISKNNDTIKSFEDLAGKTVAVQADSSHNSYMKQFDNIQLSLYPTVQEALQAVADGKEAAFVGNLETSSYLIKKYGLTNLKYVAIEAKYAGEAQSLYFAVRNDWPELVGILNKALASIDEEERIAISNKWIGVENSVDYSGIILIIEIAGAVLAIVFFVSIFWIIRLRKEVKIRKKTQAELELAKEEAVRANQIKSLFLARMSHEIRTPLNAIMGMSYLMKKTELTATQVFYLDKLMQAGRNMLGIINDILDFSKIEAGKIEIENVSFDLDKVIERVINILSIKVEEQGIEFALEKDPDMPQFFFGDPVRIEQILLNLINNAVKFTKKGMVSLSVRVLAKEDDTYQIELCVKDTGIGIDGAQLERLFVPFSQGDSSINRRFGGTGLGLSIVKNLVELMDGEIGAESVLNEGSTFKVRLPLKSDVSKEELSRKKTAAQHFRSIHALVIDKSVTARNLLAECFTAYGIVTEFANGEEEGIQLIAQAEDKNKTPYNLVVVDALTPGAGAVAWIEMIKDGGMFKKIPKFILMVPTTRNDLLEETENAGVDLMITKPVIPSVLFNGIIQIFKIMPEEVKGVSEEKKELVAPYPYNILLVEDNKTNQLIAQSILEQVGLKVCKANDGSEGYQYFLKNRNEVDLILMDIHMPVMDGYTAAGLIREADANVPIVAMTADAITGVVEQCRSHGMEYYVSKPFEPDQFIETVLNVLQNRRQEKTEDAVMKDDISSGKPALDVADGIKRIGGNEGLYRLVLQEYYNENQSVGAELAKKIDAEDYGEAEQIVHKIKSSSGNIGATGMFEVASALQRSLREKNLDAVKTGRELFQTELDRLLGEITNYLGD